MLKDKEVHDYLEILEDFTITCDIKGYRMVCQDLRHYHPDFWDSFRQAVLAESSIKPLAALLRRKDTDQMT